MSSENSTRLLMFCYHALFQPEINPQLDACDIIYTCISLSIEIHPLSPQLNK